MLILARKINESIMIGDQVEISVVDIKGDQVKLGINAPRQVKVFRREVYQLIQQENLQAAQAKPDMLPALPGLGLSGTLKHQTLESGPAASGPAASGPAASGPAASGPAASGPAALGEGRESGPRRNPPAR
jgi:carbon storage regulator